LYGTGYIPICARDTGIYFGFLTTFIFLTVKNRKHEYGFPPWYVLLFGVMGIGLGLRRFYVLRWFPHNK
jgi:uncharacterized membrane protein